MQAIWRDRPVEQMCGVRAALPRGSLFGLVSVRMTFFSLAAGRS